MQQNENCIYSISYISRQTRFSVTVTYMHINTALLQTQSHFDMCQLIASVRTSDCFAVCAWQQEMLRFPQVHERIVDVITSLLRRRLPITNTMVNEII